MPSLFASHRRGLEPLTPWSEARYSIRLSYRCRRASLAPDWLFVYAIDMKEERAEGVVLRAIPYQDSHHITTVFTGERGLISLFVRGTHRSRHFSHAVVTPLTRAEFVFGVKENKDLFRFRDAAVIDQHLNLRGDYATLEMACEMAQTLLSTQMQWKPAPQLYQLFLAYLAHTHQTNNRDALLSSFLLKVLKHEGMLALHETGSTIFDDEERAQLLLLTAARTLRDVEELEVSLELTGKIKNLFTEMTS